MDWKRRAKYTCMRARQREEGEKGVRARKRERRWEGGTDKGVGEKGIGKGGRETMRWCVRHVGSIHQLQRWDKPGRRHSYLGQLLHFSWSRWERLTLVTMWIRRTASMKRPEWPWFGVVVNELLQSLVCCAKKFRPIHLEFRVRCIVK